MAPDAEAWMADPRRAYLPVDGLQRLARLVVPTTIEVEDRLQRDVTVFRVTPWPTPTR
jgi:predicted nicotinamide N-methyase